jgi:hypothetical protein
MTDEATQKAAKATAQALLAPGAPVDDFFGPLLADPGFMQVYQDQHLTGRERAQRAREQREQAEAQPAKRQTVKDVIAKLSPEQREAMRDALNDLSSEQVAALIAEDEDVQAGYAQADAEADFEVDGPAYYDEGY